MTKRSKIALLSLLALIMAFGLILAGCPDAAGSTEYVNVPADVVKVQNVKFINGTAADQAKLTFDVVLPSESWDASKVAAAVASGAIEDYFHIVLAEAAIDLTSDYEWAATAAGKKLTVTILQSVAAVTVNSKASVLVLQTPTQNIKSLITGGKAIPADPEAAVWKYPKLISVKAVTDVVHGNGSTDKESITVELALSSGKWAANPAASDVLSLLTVTEVLTSVSTLTAPTVLSGQETSVLKVKLEAGGTTVSHVAAYTVKLNSAVSMPAGIIAASDVPALVDIDSTATSKTVTLPSTSWGEASYNSIILPAGNFLFRDSSNGKFYGVGSGGVVATVETAVTVSAIGAAAATLSAHTIVTGLDNTKTYDVYQYVTAAQATAPSGNKNLMLYSTTTTSDQGTTVGQGTANGNTIILLISTAGSTLGSLSTGTSNLPTIAKTLIDTTNGTAITWKLIASAADGAQVTYNATDHFCTVTGGTSSTAFTFKIP